MGVFHSKPVHLGEDAMQACRDLYTEIDIDRCNGININEAKNWWQSNFAVVNARAMFEAVDQNHDGTITIEEWVAFWTMVKNKGHTDEEIMEELRNLKDKLSWVQLEGVPTLRPSNKD